MLIANYKCLLGMTLHGCHLSISLTINFYSILIQGHETKDSTTTVGHGPVQTTVGAQPERQSFIRYHVFALNVNAFTKGETGRTLEKGD